MSPLEIAASLFTGISVWLSVKQHIASWPTAIVGVALYIVVCLQAKLYADMGLQVVYVVLSVYGWYEWLHGGADKGRLEASFATPRAMIVSGAIGIVFAVLLGFTLARTTDGDLPWLDSSLTSFSLVAQWLMTRKSIENWLVWIAVDVIYVPMWAYKHLYLTSALYAIFLVMAAQGLREWKRDVRRRAPALGAVPERLALVLALALAMLPFSAAAAPVDPPEPGPIQDNSFLIEEAYNQDPAIMQTIFTFNRTSGTGEWIGTITQEFPVPKITHQLSYTLGLLQTQDQNRGVGDLALNYRYQLVGNGEAHVACSPRLSLLVPTGNADRGLGSGGWGGQVSIPLSITLGKSFVAHTNLGGTLISGARTGDDRSYFVGQSLVWLAHQNANLMLEALITHGNGGPDGDPHTDVTISPGLRFALNLPGNLQIVPGIAVPFGVGTSSGRTGVFLYLSFEHPFLKRG